MNYAVKLVSQDEKTATVAGYGVVFGGQDLEMETFNPDTDYMLPLVPEKPVFYDHSFNEVQHQIGKALTVRQDDTGLWVEAQLDKHKKYVTQILELVDQGIIGWSSGSIGHLVQRDGKSIKRWPIVEFSLTPTPAEPRTIGVERLKALAIEHPELKALLPKGAGDAPADAVNGGSGEKIHTLENLETKIMNDITLTMEEYKSLLKAQVKAPDEAPAKPVEAEDPKVKAISDRLNEILARIEGAPALKDAGYVAPDSETDHAGVKSFGDFLIAVRNKNVKRLDSVYKTALAEDAGATGGYLVPTQMAAPIIAAAAPFSVLRGAGATIIPMSGKTLEVPILDVETAPSAGDTAYAAGVAAVWESEAGALDESEPRFRLDTITAYKLSGYSLASNEMRADAAALESLLTTMFGRAVGSKENHAFFRGDGVGKPMGIMSSGALITATRSAATTVALADLAQMMSDFLPSSWGRGAWFISPTVIDQLIQLVSSPISWLDNMQNGFAGLRLLGLPVNVTGALPALGTTGDILLVDPSYYIIGDRQSISIAYSEHYKFANDQGTWRFTARVGGQPWVDNSITLEDGSTTVSPFVALS